MKIIFENNNTWFNNVQNLITEDSIFSQRDLLESKLKKNGIKINKIEKVNNETIVYLTNVNNKLLVE